MVNIFQRARRYFVAAIILCLVIPTLVEASASARLSRTQVYVGDTVTLEIAIAGRTAAQPDLAPLQKDFDVIATGSGSQVQIINGQRSERQTWSIRLSPRTKGQLTVPPLTVGNDKTPPLTLMVNDIPVSGASQGAEVFLEAEVQETSVYVQQQIRLVMRLYHRLPLLSGEWSEPKIPDAVVENLTKDRRYQATRNGVIYQVVERHFAVFPERSGELKIPFTRFAGEMELPGQAYPARPGTDPAIEQFFGYDPFANDFFDRSPFSRKRGKSVRALSPELTVVVKPIPATLQSRHWLPAHSVELTDSWQKSLPDFSNGQPVTRVIELEAKGLAASQVPALEFSDQPTMGIYAESPVSSTRTDGSWVYARSRQTITYVPKANGQVDIPEVRLSWWNTASDQPDETMLPAWNLNVSGVSSLPAEAGNEPGAESEKKPNEASSTGETQAVNGASGLQIYRPVFWGAGVGVLALGVLAFWFGRKTSQSSVAMAAKQGAMRTNGNLPDANPVGRIDTACRHNDAAKARQAVLDWAATVWPDQPHHNLQAIVARIGEPSPAILELDRVLYGGEVAQWDGAALWQEIQRYLSRAKETKNSGTKETLPPLYPE